MAALTVIGTFLAQTELGGKEYRTHQHIEYPSVEDTIPNALKSFGGAIISVYHDRKYIHEVCDTVYELTEEGLSKTCL